MSTDAAARKLVGNPENPLFRVFAFYVILFSAIALLVLIAPSSLDYLNAPVPITTMSPASISGSAGPLSAFVVPDAPLRVVLGSVVSLASACVLMLPVTW